MMIYSLVLLKFCSQLLFFSFRSVLRELTHCSDSDWQTHIKSLLSEGQYTTPKRGKDVGDHPPITPVKAASSAAVGGGDYWRIYDYVCNK
ncbi:unnamed protein product, partial [Rotaria socialis]